MALALCCRWCDCNRSPSPAAPLPSRDVHLVGEFVEVLRCFGCGDDDPLLKAGLAFLLAQQDDDGLWDSGKDPYTVSARCHRRRRLITLTLSARCHRRRRLITKCEVGVRGHSSWASLPRPLLIP